MSDPREHDYYDPEDMYAEPDDWYDEENYIPEQEETE